MVALKEGKFSNFLLFAAGVPTAGLSFFCQEPHFVVVLLKVGGGEKLWCRRCRGEALPNSARRRQQAPRLK